VREALNISTKQLAAIKIVSKKKLVNSLDKWDIIQREVSILSSLKHKNVIRMLDQFFIEKSGEMYIILEYVDGGNLQQLLDKSSEKKLCFSLCRKIFKSIVKGLIYLQKENIIHRDIKPENILLMTNGVVKIGDFGSAIRILSHDELENSTFGPGSPAFQPPEKEFTNESYLKLDVWSSGVVLYMMSVGHYPFGDTSPLDMIQNISLANYSLPENFDVNLTDLLSKILIVDTELRFSFHQIMKHSWMTRKSSSSSKITIEENEISMILTPTESSFSPENIELIVEYAKDLDQLDDQNRAKNKEPCGIM